MVLGQRVRKTSTSSALPCVTTHVFPIAYDECLWKNNQTSGGVQMDVTRNSTSRVGDLRKNPLIPISAVGPKESSYGFAIIMLVAPKDAGCAH